MNREYTVINTEINKNKLISVREFAELTGIGQNTCYSLVNLESFPKIKVGRRILIIKDQVDDWIKDNKGKEF